MVEQTNEIVLNAEQRELFEKAIKEIKDIMRELWDESLMADEEGVFLTLLENYESNDGELSKYIEYEE